MLTYNFSIWKSHYSRNHYLFTIISGSQLKSPVIKVPSIMNFHLRGNFILAKTTLERLFWQKIHVTFFFASLLNLQCLESSVFYVLKCSVKQMLWAVETSWRSHRKLGRLCQVCPHYLYGVQPLGSDWNPQIFIFLSNGDSSSVVPTFED